MISATRSYEANVTALMLQKSGYESFGDRAVERLERMFRYEINPALLSRSINNRAEDKPIIIQQQHHLAYLKTGYGVNNYKRLMHNNYHYQQGNREYT